MKGKVILSLLGVAAGVTLALVLLLAQGGSTAVYHTGTGLVCYDCHTMHDSMQHGWAGGAVGSKPPAPGSGAVSGDWIIPGDGNPFLLKQPVNLLCLGCHDGSQGAPDVLGANTNAPPDNGRSAGALNQDGLGGGYSTWMGHTLGSSNTPPGYNPTLVGASDFWAGMAPLSCANCHSVHGRGGPTNYRNLRLASSIGNSTLRTAAQPTFVLGTTNDASMDVWINITPSGTPGARPASDFNPYYATKNVFYNKPVMGTTIPGTGALKTDNRLATFCAVCHANFHGGEGNANIQNGEFLRHPTAAVPVPDRWRQAGNRVKVTNNSLTQDPATGNASPFCLSCHKAHGNMNPFGLVFLSRASTDPYTEEGSTTNTATGMRNLCGQCHSEGN